MKQKTVIGHIGGNTYQAVINDYKENCHEEQIDSAMSHIKTMAEADGYDSSAVFFNVV